MLYRVRHGNLDFPKGHEPEVAVLLCGTNNYGVTQSDGGKAKWDLGIKTPPADAIEPVIERFIEAGPVEPEDPRAPRSIPRP
jgi:hypothetical protein